MDADQVVGLQCLDGMAPFRGVIRIEVSGRSRDVDRRADRVRATAREEQVSLTDQARSEAEQELERARNELAQSLGEARETLRASAEDLATAAAEQVLGRNLS